MTEPLRQGWARGRIRWHDTMSCDVLNTGGYDYDVNVYPTSAELVRATGNHYGTLPGSYSATVAYVVLDGAWWRVMPYPYGTAYECNTCMVMVPNDMSCGGCLPCALCDTRHVRDRLTRTAYGQQMCRACRSGYRRCGDCSNWFPTDYVTDGTCDDCAYGSSNCDCGGCDGCDSDSDSDDTVGGLVRSYGHKPEPMFHGEGTLFLGPEIELEVEYGYSYARAAQIAADALGTLGYLKHDGSLSNGFEIVTHPMSFDYAMQSFPWEMLAELKSAGAYESTRAGIHVHVSREGFSGKAHIYRWLKLFYRNERMVTTFAGRQSSYASFDSRFRDDCLSVARGNRYGERYQAVNPANEDTLEVRIFASTTDADRLRAIFSFVHASIEYARTLTSHDVAHHDGWDWSTFATWVDSHQDTYPQLHNTLEKMSCAF